MSMFSDAIAAGMAAIRAGAGDKIVYRVGTTDIPIPDALKVTGTKDEELTGQVVFDSDSQEWRFGRASLHINGTPVTPEAGHQILFTKNGVTEIYTVSARDGGQCYDFTGNGDSQYEVFTEKVG